MCTDMLLPGVSKDNLMPTTPTGLVRPSPLNNAVVCMSVMPAGLCMCGCNLSPMAYALAACSGDCRPA